MSPTHICCEKSTPLNSIASVSVKGSGQYLSVYPNSCPCRGVGKTFWLGGAQYVINYFVVQNIYGTDWKLGGHVPPVPPWFLRLWQCLPKFRHPRYAGSVKSAQNMPCLSLGTCCVICVWMYLNLGICINFAAKWCKSTLIKLWIMCCLNLGSVLNIYRILLEVLNFDKDFEKHLNSCKREWNSTMCYRLASLQLIELRV